MSEQTKLKQALQREQHQQHFADKLLAEIARKQSPVCVGLDPRLEQVPTFIKDKALLKYKDKFRAAAEAILDFNKGIIDAIADLVPIVKPQSAFYEQYGHYGVKAFHETIQYARSKGLLILADIKRGDIGTTAEAYSNAFLGQVDLFGEPQFSMDVDAVTLNPYMGLDTMRPFLKDARKFGKGIFLLVKTSNPSSPDIQDLEMADHNTVYQIMAHYLDSWGADDIGESGYSLLGAVVGATYPKQAAKLREIMPQAIFLVPGYGAQGGTAEDVKVCFDKEGRGAIINSSRGIIYAYQDSDQFVEKDYADAAREAVITMRNDLNKVL